MEIKKTSNRLLEIDALRGIACVLVILFHYTMGREQASYGFRLGVTGVDLFFIISGFVIFMTLEKTKKWKDFVISRFSRLYPTYWTCIIITTCLILFNRYLKGETLSIVFPISLGNLTMFQYYLGIENLDGPYWSLIIELLFYVFMLTLFLTKQLKNVMIIGGVFFCLRLFIIFF